MFAHPSFDERVVCSASLKTPGQYRKKYTWLSPLGGGAEWPRQTEICCFHCTEPFDGPPATLPSGLDPATGTWELTGVFCGWACARRYAQEHTDRSTSGSVLWLEQLASEMGHRGPIEPAPPRQALVKFGGPMTLQEFRGNRARVGLLERPFLPRDVAIAVDTEVCVSSRLRGLRRPSATSSAGAGDAACIKEGAYSKFLRQRASSCESASAATSAATAPDVAPATVPATAEESRHKGSLLRFVRRSSSGR